MAWELKCCLRASVSSQYLRHTGQVSDLSCNFKWFVKSMVFWKKMLQRRHLNFSRGALCESRCTSRFSLFAYLFGHCGHLNGRLTIWCVSLMWFFCSIAFEKLKLHSKHLYFVSSVCSRLSCIRRWLFRVNDFGQLSHLNLVPLWVRICSWSTLCIANPLSHTEQINGRMFVWAVLKCTFRSLERA